MRKKNNYVLNNLKCPKNKYHLSLLYVEILGDYHFKVFSSVLSAEY